MLNPYVPYPVTIEDITIENELKDLKTFKLVFDRPDDYKAFSYMPGQFAELSLFGIGEAPFGIASSPSEDGYVMFTIKKAGNVTRALHNMEKGAKIGIRGPLGNYYPWDNLEGKDILIVAGGFAFTTMRSSILYMLANRKKYGKITIVYGASRPGELLYKDLLASWKEEENVNVALTVDRTTDEDSWNEHVGVVPAIVKKIEPSSANCVTIVCGPPIMIKYTIPVLFELGFPKEDIILSLENRMKCGIGKCGRCNIGPKYVCADGPVFTFAEMEKLPQE
ncbi:MAG: FAD/NAD(P)-binding protein [Spirochaetales bacterium]|nr:FAD/NAD(P)-binding protein [Spirochaetales bacterium]